MTVYAMDFMFPGVLIHSGFCSLFKVVLEEGGRWAGLCFYFSGKTSRLLALIDTLTHRHTYTSERVYVCVRLRFEHKQQRANTYVHTFDCSPRTWVREIHLDSAECGPLQGC